MAIQGLKVVVAVTFLGAFVACSDPEYRVPVTAADSAGAMDQLFEGVAAGKETSGADVELEQAYFDVEDLTVPALGDLRRSYSMTEFLNERPAETTEAEGAGAPVVESAPSFEPEAPAVEMPDHTGHLVVNDPPSVELVKDSAAKELVEMARLTCGEEVAEELCFEKAALVMSLEEVEGGYNPTMCTGHLVADGVLATAAHCLPQDLVKGSSCTAEVAVGFYQGAGEPLAAVACAEVLEDFQVWDLTGQDEPQRDLSRADLVFLLLEESVPVPDGTMVSRAGFHEAERYRFVSIRPYESGTPGGVVEVRSCQPVENTVVLPHHVDSRAETVVLMGEGCQAPSGNSGALVTREQTGEIVGVVHAFMDEATQKYRDLNFPVAEEGVLNPVVATNFACLNSEVLETLGARRDAACGGLEGALASQTSERSETLFRQFTEALEVSRQQVTEALRAHPAAEWVGMNLRTQQVSNLKDPLRVVEESHQASFICHNLAAEGGYSFELPVTQTITYQYLDRFLRIAVASASEQTPAAYELEGLNNGLARLTAGDFERHLGPCARQ